MKVAKDDKNGIEKDCKHTLNTVHEGNIIERHTGGLEKERRRRKYINFLGKRILNGNDKGREGDRRYTHTKEEREKEETTL